MKAIRAAFTAFLLLIIVFAALGWHWAISLPAEKMVGARSVLAAITAASIGAMVVIWKVKPAKTH